MPAACSYEQTNIRTFSFPARKLRAADKQPAETFDGLTVSIIFSLNCSAQKNVLEQDAYKIERSSAFGDPVMISVSHGIAIA